MHGPCPCWVRSVRTEYGAMDEQTVRKSFNDQLNPTPVPEPAMAFVVRRCRDRATAALHARRATWQLGGVSIPPAGVRAQGPAGTAVRPASPGIHSPTVPDRLTRRDTAFQAVVRRVRDGQTPGDPRVQGATRSNAFTSHHGGTGATLDNGLLVLSPSGNRARRCSRPLEGTPATGTISRAADCGSVGCSGADGPVHSLLAPTGPETGSTRGLEACAALAHGTRSVPPGGYRQAERALPSAPRRGSRRPPGSHRRRPAGTLLATAHLQVKRPRADVHHPTARALVSSTATRAHEALPTARLVTHHPLLATSISAAGWRRCVRIRSATAAGAGRTVVAVRRPTRVRRARAAVSWSRRVSPFGGPHAQTVARASIGTTPPPRPSRGAGSAFGPARRSLRRRTAKLPA
jgi:putative transposase